MYAYFLEFDGPLSSENKAHFTVKYFSDLYIDPVLFSPYREPVLVVMELAVIFPLLDPVSRTSAPFHSSNVTDTAPVTTIQHPLVTG